MTFPLPCYAEAYEFTSCGLVWSTTNGSVSALFLIALVVYWVRICEITLYRRASPLSLRSEAQPSTAELSHYPCALRPSSLPPSYPTIPVFWTQPSTAELFHYTCALGPALYRRAIPLYLRSEAQPSTAELSHYTCVLGPSPLPLSYPTIPVLWAQPSTAEMSS